MRKRFRLYYNDNCIHDDRAGYLDDKQIKVPETAGEHGGLQPVVDARANGEKSIIVKAGEPVSITAGIEVPPMAGRVTAAVWYYERTDEFSRYEDLVKEEEGRIACVKTKHVLEKPGIYFPVLKAQRSRDGKLDDMFV